MDTGAGPQEKEIPVGNGCTDCRTATSRGMPYLAWSVISQSVQESQKFHESVLHMVNVHTGRTPQPEFPNAAFVYTDRRADDEIVASYNGYSESEFQAVFDTNSKPEDIGLQASMEFHPYAQESLPVYWVPKVPCLELHVKMINGVRASWDMMPERLTVAQPSATYEHCQEHLSHPSHRILNTIPQTSVRSALRTRRIGGAALGHREEPPLKLQRPSAPAMPPKPQPPSGWISTGSQQALPLPATTHADQRRPSDSVALGAQIGSSNAPKQPPSVRSPGRPIALSPQPRAPPDTARRVKQELVDLPRRPLTIRPGAIKSRPPTTPLKRNPGHDSSSGENLRRRLDTAPRGSGTDFVPVVDFAKSLGHPAMRESSEDDRSTSDAVDLKALNKFERALATTPLSKALAGARRCHRDKSLSVDDESEG